MASSSHMLNNNIHMKKAKDRAGERDQQRPLSGIIRERSAAACEGNPPHTGDPAHLRFRLWLMTL